MNDLISIIVNIYNNEKTIKECIISLIAQTYRNIEIILIDDGSQDSSGKVCDDLVLSSVNPCLVPDNISQIRCQASYGHTSVTGQNMRGWTTGTRCQFYSSVQ